MLSSIHPLGERARDNRWALTVTAFTVGAVVAGALVGGALGAMGGLTPRTPGWALGLTGTVAAAAGALDLTGARPPGPRRQVNEHWIGRYRGWVYGGAFGGQLGAGVATFVVTWTVYAVFAAEIASGSPVTGAVIGAVFGFGRSLALILAGVVDRPSRLTGFHRRMAQLGPLVRRGGAMLATVAGIVGIIGVML